MPTCFTVLLFLQKYRLRWLEGFVDISFVAEPVIGGECPEHSLSAGIIGQHEICGTHSKVIEGCQSPDIQLRNVPVNSVTR